MRWSQRRVVTRLPLLLTQHCVWQIECRRVCMTFRARTLALAAIPDPDLNPASPQALLAQSLAAPCAARQRRAFAAICMPLNHNAVRLTKPLHAALPPSCAARIAGASLCFAAAHPAVAVLNQLSDPSAIPIRLPSLNEVFYPGCMCRFPLWRVAAAEFDTCKKLSTGERAADAVVMCAVRRPS